MTKDFTSKKKLFIIADAGVDTGFATVTHNLVEHLHTLWDIHILAINYHGDPHPIQSKAKLYNPSARAQGDFYGVERIAELAAKIKPDLIFMINDPWVATSYVRYFKKISIPMILYTPIDAQNLKEEWVTPLKRFDHIVTYTEFGKHELLSREPFTNISVIPHGVNTKLYKPISREETRSKNKFEQDWFIVNVTDRNQIRKRIDLAFHYFAEWVKRYNLPTSVKLYYHGAIKDEGWDIMQLSQELGLRNDSDLVEGRIILTAPNVNSREGIPLDLMPYVYSVADIGLSTTMGEGWGMTVHERMAMGIPMIVPEYSALAEWPKGGVHYTRISDIPFYNINGLNTRGGIADMEDTIQALQRMYIDSDYRNKIARAGYNIATDIKFNWRTIARQFNEIFKKVLHGQSDTRSQITTTQ